MPELAWWIVAGVVVIAIGGVIAWRFRPRPNPNSLEELGLLPKSVTGDPEKDARPISMEDLGLFPTSIAADPEEVERLRQSLRVKVMYDEAKIDSLIEAERERQPSASEVELYRAAVERWERENR